MIRVVESPPPTTTDITQTQPGQPERVQRNMMVKFLVVLVCLLMETSLVLSFVVVLVYWIFLSDGVEEQKG